MTSTNINVGLDATNRMTSRVLKPPGGGHTDIFGAAEPEIPRGRRHQQSSIVLGTENANVEKPTNGHSAAAAAATDNNENSAPARSVESVDAPEQSKPEAPVDNKPEPPRRVRVPPGGFSSGLW